MSFEIDWLLEDSSLTDVQLDSEFFDEENNLRDDVREVMLKVVGDIVGDLLEKDFRLIPEYVALTGSLTGPNWDEYSDVDLHLGVNFTQYPDPDLVRRFLALYASDFNHRDYDLLNRELEVYFQDVTEPHDSPGVYDVENDHWVKVPDGIRIDITEEARKAADSYRVEVVDLKTEYERSSKTGAEVFLNRLLAYWQSIRQMRKEAMLAQGRASFGNQVFKLLRRNNTLEMLTGLIRQVRDDVYEVFRDIEPIESTTFDFS